jgi:hypothetical protein
VTDPAAPILEVAQTEIEIQTAAANGRDAIAVGLLGVDAGLLAAGIALQSTLGHSYWQALVAIGFSGLLALGSLMVGGVTVGLTPKQTYDRFRGKTEEEIYRGLIAILETAVTTSSGRLSLKAWLLGGSIATIIATVVITAALL